MNDSDLYNAWKQNEHIEVFGNWNQTATWSLIRQCRRFNDFQLVETVLGNQGCSTLSDVGCATGGFFRFFRHVAPSLEYKGFDISEPAVAHAKLLHPSGSFTVFDGKPKSLDAIKSDVLFCKDVVVHQTNPTEFLSDLYDTTYRFLVLRILTRELGDTVFDVSGPANTTTDVGCPILFSTLQSWWL